MTNIIPQTNNRYTISDTGVVYDAHLNRVMNQYKKPNGYMFVRLVKEDGGCFFPYVHRLVAMAFIPNTNNGNEVNHKDGNKENNTKDNLEWMSHSSNQLHRFRVLKKPAIKKGTSLVANMKKVVQRTLNGRPVALYDSLLEASKKTGSSYSNISQCVHGKRKQCNGYKWELYGDLR